MNASCSAPFDRHPFIPNTSIPTVTFCLSRSYIHIHIKRIQMFYIDASVSSHCALIYFHAVFVVDDKTEKEKRYSQLHPNTYTNTKFPWPTSGWLNTKAAIKQRRYYARHSKSEICSHRCVRCLWCYSQL